LASARSELSRFRSSRAGSEPRCLACSEGSELRFYRAMNRALPALTCGCRTATRWRDFFFNRSPFNRFAHGNRKLPCSTLSGVECLSPPPRAQHGQKTSNPQPPSRTATTSPLAVPESPHRPLRIGRKSEPGKHPDRTRITARIGEGSREESGRGRPADRRLKNLPLTGSFMFR
jgi:hypothetical protein